MDVGTYELTVFRTVVEVGSMSGAAQHIRVTQPAVSAVVKKVESWADVQLFVRTKKGVVPTRAGKKLYDASHRLMQELSSLRHGLHEESGFRGSLKLGIHPSLAVSILPAFMAKVLTAHPLLEVQLQHDISSQVAEAVVNCEVDFGIVSKPPSHPALVTKLLYRGEMSYWTSINDSPLQEPTAAGSVVYCHTALGSTQELLRRAKRNHRLKSSRIINSNDFQVIAALVASGAGIGILPARIASTNSGLAPLSEFPKVRDPIMLIYRKETVEVAAAACLQELILKSCR